MTIERKLVDLVNIDNLEAARQLIEVGLQVGLDINAALPMRILHSAVLRGMPEMVSLILEQPGLNIDLFDIDYTAVHLAAKQKTPEMLTMLLNCGANCQLQSKMTRTFPIIGAVRFGCVENIQLLLDKKANLAAKDNDELEALDYALRQWRHVTIQQQLANAQFEQVSENAIRGSTVYLDALENRNRAQQMLQQTINMLLLLLRNGAGIGRDLAELQGVMEMDNDGCYSLDNVPCVALIEVDSAQPFLSKQNSRAIQCYKLRPDAPLEQYILRCAERLADTDSDAIRQLERYFQFASGKISLQYLCMEQIAREPTVNAVVAQISAEDVVAKMNTLLTTSMDRELLQRHYAICRNRLDEIMVLERKLQSFTYKLFSYESGSYVLDHVRFLPLFILFSLLILFLIYCGNINSSVELLNCTQIDVAGKCNNTGIKIKCINELSNILSNRPNLFDVAPMQRDHCIQQFRVTMGYGLASIILIMLGSFAFLFIRAQNRRISHLLASFVERITAEDQNGNGLHGMTVNANSLTDSGQRRKFINEYQNYLQQLSERHPQEQKFRFFQKHFLSLPAVPENIAEQDADFEEHQDDVRLLSNDNA